MYTENFLTSRPPLCNQEIDCVPLHKPVLSLIDANLDPFQIMDTVDRGRISENLKYLNKIKLIKPNEDDDEKEHSITPLGSFVRYGRKKERIC